MAGIYIHIPFCSKACHYCDFHFTTSDRYIEVMADAIALEASLECPYLKGEIIETIYFGGGTPSLLTSRQLEKILIPIFDLYQVATIPEITFEANPEDISPEKIKDWRDLGINRISLGIQSFHEPFLKFLNRSHTSSKGISALKMIREGNIENITFDLIYGIPSTDHLIWKEDLKKAIEFSPEHLSAYCLTIEPKTVFGKWLKAGKLFPADDHFSAEQFEILMTELDLNGYEHYEISNFCKPGRYSKHNSAYWQNKNYLGLGPSAHSFNGESRRSNISNNAQYMEGINNRKPLRETEILTEKEKANDYILTSLRTSWGMNLKILENWAGLNAEKISYLENLKQSDFVSFEGDIVRLTRKGKLLADEISLRLLFV